MPNDVRPAGQGTPVTIDARSIEQAVVKAAAMLGVTQAEIKYEILSETSTKGFLSFFKQPTVTIKAWTAPSKAARAPAAQSQRARGAKAGTEGDRRPRRQEFDADTGDAEIAAEPLPPEKIEALKTELAEFCAGICSHIADEPVTVTTTLEGSRLVLDLGSEVMAQHVARNTKLAEALEHILRKKPRHLRQELPFRIFVDVNGIRRQRESELVTMAHDLSAKVFESKRPIVLNYKSSYDRKIIHMALDKDERVYTKSIGSGPNRKLMILPSRDGRGGDDLPLGDVEALEHE